jgi:transposase
MKLHRNAALSWRGRQQLARRVVDQGWSLQAAAEASGVSVRCCRKWVGRYRLEGEQGLLDRSSAPRRVANRTPNERVQAIVALRSVRFTAAEIAELLAMPLSTVSGILGRLGLGRLARQAGVGPRPRESRLARRTLDNAKERTARGRIDAAARPMMLAVLVRGETHSLERVALFAAPPRSKPRLPRDSLAPARGRSYGLQRPN